MYGHLQLNNMQPNQLYLNSTSLLKVNFSKSKFIFSKIFCYPYLDLFESIMSYYTDDVRAFQRVPGKSIQQRMKNFLDDPKKYYGFDASHYERFAKNAMMWDFGYAKKIK